MPQRQNGEIRRGLRAMLGEHGSRDVHAPDGCRYQGGDHECGRTVTLPRSCSTPS